MVQANLEGRNTEQMDTSHWKVPLGITCMMLGVVAIYATLLGTGHLIYGNWIPGILLFTLTAIATWLLAKKWKKISP